MARTEFNLNQAAKRVGLILEERVGELIPGEGPSLPPSATMTKDDLEVLREPGTDRDRYYWLLKLIKPQVAPKDVVRLPELVAQTSGTPEQQRLFAQAREALGSWAAKSDTRTQLSSALGEMGRNLNERLREQFFFIPLIPRRESGLLESPDGDVASTGGFGMYEEAPALGYYHPDFMRRALSEATLEAVPEKLRPVYVNTIENLRDTFAFSLQNDTHSYKLFHAVIIPPRAVRVLRQKVVAMIPEEAEQAWARVSRQVSEPEWCKPDRFGFDPKRGEFSVASLGATAFAQALLQRPYESRNGIVITQTRPRERGSDDLPLTLRFRIPFTGDDDLALSVQAEVIKVYRQGDMSNQDYWNQKLPNAPITRGLPDWAKLISRL